MKTLVVYVKSEHKWSEFMRDNPGLNDMYQIIKVVNFSREETVVEVLPNE